MERLLGTPMLSELLVDYVGDRWRSNDRTTRIPTGSRFHLMASIRMFQWTAGRDVTMDWSPCNGTYPVYLSHATSTMASSPAQRSAACIGCRPNGTPFSSLTPRSSELQSDTLPWYGAHADPP
jgi:hypothetical protein